MFGWLKKRREAKLRERVRSAASAHHEYERERLQRRGEDHAFPHDQRARAIVQRVERSYRLDGKEPPPGIERLVAKELGPAP